MKNDLGVLKLLGMPSYKEALCEGELLGELILTLLRAICPTVGRTFVEPVGPMAGGVETTASGPSFTIIFEMEEISDPDLLHFSNWVFVESTKNKDSVNEKLLSGVADHIVNTPLELTFSNAKTGSKFTLPGLTGYHFLSNSELLKDALAVAETHAIKKSTVIEEILNEQI